MMDRLRHVHRGVSHTGLSPHPQPKSEQGLPLTGLATIWFIVAEPGRGRPRKVRPMSRGLLLGVGDPHGWFSGDGAKVREAAASLPPWCRSGCCQAGVEVDAMGRGQLGGKQLSGEKEAASSECAYSHPG